MIEVREEFDTTCPYCQQSHTAIAAVEVDEPEPVETHYCKKEKADGGLCEREVDDPLARCWQHSED